LVDAVRDRQQDFATCNVCVDYDEQAVDFSADRPQTGETTHELNPKRSILQEWEKPIRSASGREMVVRSSLLEYSPTPTVPAA
jgi:hypothetical protein